MNDRTDFDRLAGMWLQDGPSTMPDRSLHAALDEVHLTSQQRFGAARRTFNVNGNALRLAALAVAAVLIIAVGGVYLRNNNASGGVGGAPAATASPTPAPTPSPTPTATPSPLATPIVTTGWIPFSSTRFGYEMAIPPTWTATPAVRDWSLAIDNEATTGADVFVDVNAAYQIAVQAFSTTMAPGTSNTDWIASVTGSYNGCTPLPIDQWETITVDGQQAMFDPNACDASQAFVFIGNRVYRFSVWRGDQTALLKAFLSTVRFHPVAAPSGHPSATP